MKPEEEGVDEVVNPKVVLWWGGWGVGRLLKCESCWGERRGLLIIRARGVVAS